MSAFNYIRYNLKSGQIWVKIQIAGRDPGRCRSRGIRFRPRNVPLKKTKITDSEG